MKCSLKVRNDQISKPMIKIIREIRSSPRFWWKLSAVWTVVVYAAIISNFFKNGAYNNGLDALLVIYVAILAIYAGDKEFERWHDRHSHRHPGEAFVIFWTLIVVGIAACQFIFDKPAGLTSEIVATYIAVLSVLAVTRRSKSLYAKRIRRQI